MTHFRSIIEADVIDKRVLIREDFNVPILQDRVVNDRRIQAALPTIEYLLTQNAAVILVSHLGRPTTHSSATEFSLQPVANCLSQHLKQPVRLEKNWVTGVQIKPGEVVLCENVRLQPKEQMNDANFSKTIAQLADIVVMDAFAVAHRASPSTVGLIQEAKEAYAGLLLTSEIENLEPFNHPERPFVALMGGAKVTTKLNELELLMQRVDHLLLGGGLANTFLAAQSTPMGNSFHEPSCVEAAKRLLQLADSFDCKIHLPQDVVVSDTNQHDLNAIMVKRIREIQPQDKVGDIGPITINDYTQILKDAGTIFWNGPMGIFEQSNFESGTRLMAEAISHSNAFSIAGGGETLNAIDQWQCYPTCISTGGGALLAWLTGQPLAAIEALQARAEMGFK